MADAFAFFMRYRCYLPRFQRRAGWTVGIVFLTAPFSASCGECRIVKLADLRVSLVANQPMIDGQVNGQAAKFLVDTGSSMTFIRAEAAHRLGLKLDNLPNVSVYGVGGEARVSRTVIKEVRFGPVRDYDFRLLVLSSQVAMQVFDADIVLGQDFFERFDTEFDLANGAIRLLRPEGCELGQLPYWSKQYSLAEISKSSGVNAHIRLDVVVNGVHTDAFLDSGATKSILAKSIAKRAGVDPASGGAKPDGTVIGWAGKPVDTWTVNFGTFQLGDETISNVKLSVADMFSANKSTKLGSRLGERVEGMPAMLLGLDFFRSHRLLVLLNEHKLLFT